MGALPYILDPQKDKDKKLISEFLQNILTSPENKDELVSSLLVKSETIRKDYRNAAAHTKPIKEKSIADKCCEMIIGLNQNVETDANECGALLQLLYLTENYDCSVKQKNT